METLGGDLLWWDRFLAYHSAIVYYWILVALFFVSPPLAYNFSELIEAHAVDTCVPYGRSLCADQGLYRGRSAASVGAMLDDVLYVCCQRPASCKPFCEI